MSASPIENCKRFHFSISRDPRRVMITWLVMVKYASVVWKYVDNIVHIACF